MVMSGRSATTAFAAAFIKAKALRSFGFSNAYLAHILRYISLVGAYTLGHSVLGECSSIDANNNPGVWKERVWLLKLADILISTRGVSIGIKECSMMG